MPTPISDISSASGASAIEIVGEAVSAASARPSASSSPADTSAPPADATNLSPLGNLLSNVTQSARAQPSVRTDVVARIKSQVSSGTYKPDALAVAASIHRALRAHP
jgi:flagellar biosynthesis anti-sigma factor FlgM